MISIFTFSALYVSMFNLDSFGRSVGSDQAVQKEARVSQGTHEWSNTHHQHTAEKEGEKLIAYTINLSFDPA
jgi:hypothetical protein